MRISPQNAQNDIDDSEPQALFNHVAKSLARKAAYLHIVEGDTSGKPVSAFDYGTLKRLFGGLVIANNNLTAHEPMLPLPKDALT